MNSRRLSPILALALALALAGCQFTAPQPKEKTPEAIGAFPPLGGWMCLFGGGSGYLCPEEDPLERR